MGRCRGPAEESQDTAIAVGSQTAWQKAPSLPAGSQNSHRNGGRVFLILVADPRRSHSGIDDVDYLIAATAIVTDAGLLTTNVPPLSDVRRAAASMLTTYGRHHCRSGRAVSIPSSSSFVAST